MLIIQLGFKIDFYESNFFKIYLSSLYKGLSDSDEFPFYSDMYKDYYTSNTDELTDDEDFTASGSVEGSAEGSDYSSLNS